MPTDVRVQTVYYHCPAYDMPPPMMRGGIHINLPKIITGMVQDEQRNALLVSAMQEAAERQGRKILCLSDRRAHCQALLHLFQQACPSKKASLYVGGMKASDLAEAASTADILFATYGLASEGLDIPALDTLVMCTSRSSIEQAVGRVLRGATNPLIIDVLDKFSVCYAQYNKRKAYYLSCGFHLDQGCCTAEENNGYAFLPDDDDD